VCFKVTEATDFTELQDKEPWLSSSKLVVKPDMLFGKRGKSGLVALNLDLAQVASFVKERLGKEVFFPFLDLSLKPDIHDICILFYFLVVLSIFLSTLLIYFSHVFIEYIG
jgi:succinyl-CoA synthetase beta subunit